MRGAPPVRLVCGPDARWQAFERVLHALAAAVAGAWLGWQAGWPGSVLAIVAAAAAVTAFVWIRWRQLGEREAVLDWTGQQWQLDGQDCRPPSLRIDLGRWLLLRIDGGLRARRWLAADLTQGGAPAHLVRAALHAHGPASDAAAPRVGGHV